MELTKDEKKLFLAICKYVRESQNLGLIKKMTDSVRLNVPEIRTTFFEFRENGSKRNIKKLHRVAYSLEEKGLIKVSKTYGYRGKYVNIDTKGVEYINYLKERII
ncbi:hypothetical protein CN918_29175 [Priestia megaterium]|nr:hypothetical protein CN918_29175 [Priestia megaterium]